MPRNYRSRTRSRSQSRSRSGSRSRTSRNQNRDHRGSGGYRRGDDSNHNNSEHVKMDMCRLHIADLTEKVSKGDIEKSFSKFGEMEEVWIAKNPPCFAFVVFKTREDAAEALKEMDGRTLCGRRIRVSQALPRTRGRNKRWDSDTRCYQCGRVGHFSRDCRSNDDARRRSRYSRSNSREPHRARQRARSKSRTRSYSRSRSPARSHNKRSRSRSANNNRNRSPSPNVEHKNGNGYNSDRQSKSKSRSLSRHRSMSRPRDEFKDDAVEALVD